MNLIIFSKNRACQLELLFHSMEEFWPEAFTQPIKVLYTYTNEEYRQGYEILQADYPDVKWYKEDKFKLDLLKLVDSNQPYTIFFVDDIVFKAPFNLQDPEVINFQHEPSILALSLRLHPHLNYCYAANIPMRPPVMNRGTWSWQGREGDYGYPMSLDGHIFRTAELHPRLFHLPYHNPNSLEAIMAQYPLASPLLACYEESKIINNPCNKVQTNNPNRHGNINAAELNTKFLEGYRLDLQPFRGIKNLACHQEMPISWLKI